MDRFLVEETHAQTIVPPKRTTVFSLPWVDVTTVGLHVRSREISWEQYDQIVHVLLTMENASQWSIGDAYNLGAINFKGRDPSQPFTARRVVNKTIQNYAWVCNRYFFNQRFYPPSFSHHAIVAKLVPSRREYWLMKAANEDLSVEDLSELTRSERGLKLIAPDPFSLLIERYNGAIEAFNIIPRTWPERDELNRGLKIIENAIGSIRERMKHDVNQY